MNRKFIVAIEETVVQEFEEFANSGDEALKKAKEKYERGEIVLEPGEVTFRQMSLSKPNDKATEWCEF